MSECCDSDDDILICTENCTEDASPTAEEINSYASSIGIKCELEQYLIPVAVNALKQPLPKHWIPCYCKKFKNFFYYNKKRGIAQWEHPLDSFYKKLIPSLRRYCEVGNDNLSHDSEITDKDVFITEFVDTHLKMLPRRQQIRPLGPIRLSSSSDRNVDHSISSATRNESGSKKSVTFSTTDRYSSNIEDVSPMYGDFERDLFKERYVTVKNNSWNQRDARTSILKETNSNSSPKQYNSFEQDMNRGERERQALRVRLPAADSMDDTTHDSSSDARWRNISESGIDVHDEDDEQEKKIEDYLKKIVNAAVDSAKENIMMQFEEMLSSETMKLEESLKIQGDMISDIKSNYIKVNENDVHRTQISDINQRISSFEEKMNKVIQEKFMEFNTYKKDTVLKLNTLEDKLLKEIKSQIDSVVIPSAKAEKSLDDVKLYVDERINSSQQTLVNRFEELDRKVENKFIELNKKYDEELQSREDRQKTLENQRNSNVRKDEVGSLLRNELNEIFSQHPNGPKTNAVTYIESIVSDVLKKIPNRKLDEVEKKSVASQTELLENEVEISDIKVKLGNVISLIDEMSDRMNVLRRSPDLNNLKVASPFDRKRLGSSSTNYNGLRNMDDVDKELEYYRQKYLWGSKYSLQKRGTK